MIAVDTSALMAVILAEPESPACIDALSANDEILISAATLAEAHIVADRRNVGHLMRSMIAGLPIATVPCSAETAMRVAEIYSRWGKGRHPARLGLIDCFSYDVATEHQCPLLFVGADFARTDIVSALAL